MGELSWWHWLIVVLVFVLLFGSKRLPDAARSLGKSLRILKTEVKGLHDDDEKPAEAGAPAAALPPAPGTPEPAPTAATATTTATTPASDSSDPR